MSKHYPRIRIDRGAYFIREGVSIDFYMHPHSHMGQGVIGALDAYVRAVGPQTLDGYVDEEGDWQKLDDAILARIRDEMLAGTKPTLLLTGTPHVEQWYQFQYRGKRPDLPAMRYLPGAMSAMSVWLPTEYLEEHGPGRVCELAMELASSLPFLCSGYAGLSFHCSTDMVGVMNKIKKFCFRYPGLDIPDLGWLSLHIGTHVRGPAWLTFLGQPLLGQLGGVAELRSRLRSEGTTVQEMEGDRAVITLGPWPKAGDTERGDVLPAYRELARVLEPWLYHQEKGRRPVFTPEDMLRWERRFLD
ncbi:DUF3396 domain-containing protein [Archangium lipolyticum]|uniref:DUF3396 domain-containing protein n=1 Tax=Archangium lipolyticum TaxID=2970465 RepID=UPI002149FBD1|nr:DUF3396 domain-containing protein [Archangium lipolyticum]